MKELEIEVISAILNIDVKVGDGIKYFHYSSSSSAPSGFGFVKSINRIDIGTENEQFEYIIDKDTRVKHELVSEVYRRLDGNA